MIARVLVFAVIAAGAGEASADSNLSSLGSVDGVEFFIAMNEPQTSCAYGGIKNRTQNRLEVRWSYVATWSDGHSEVRTEHDWLAPGESKAGWAYYLVCADDHGRISKVRIDNVHVKDLTLEEKVKEAERLAQDLERQRKEQEERIARENKERIDRENKERIDRENKERIDRENKERIDRENKERIARERATQDRKNKPAGTQSGGHSGGGCDAGCQRQQQLSLELERQRQANEANRQLGDAMGAAAGQVFLAKGGNEAQSWSTRLFALTFGFGMRLAPVMTDTTGSQINSFSSQDSGGGLSLALGLEYWPLFRKWLGLGIVVGATGGGLVMPGGLLHQLHLEGGARAYLGNRAGWSITAELGIARTSVGNSSVLLGAITKGSGSYVATRFGVGPAWCAIEKDDAPGQCTLALGAKLLWDATGLGDTSRVYQGTIDWHSGILGRLGIYFELGRGYPAPGTATYPLDLEDQDRAGTRIAVMLTKGFTWFGGRVAAPRSSSSRERAHSRAGESIGALPGLPTVVWASRVRSVSSEYAAGYTGDEALGAPNVYPRHGDLVGAWASRSPDAGPEHIEVELENPRRGKAIVVVETFNPGAIVRVLATSDRTHELRLESKGTSDEGAVITTYELAGGSCSTEPVTTVRVELDSVRVPGWNEIDAIGLVPCD